jgi:hypothetical protein
MILSPAGHGLAIEELKMHLITIEEPIDCCTAALMT